MEECKRIADFWGSEEALILFLSNPEKYKTTQKHIAQCKICLGAFEKSLVEKLSIEKNEDRVDLVSITRWISDDVEINNWVNTALKDHFKKNNAGLWDSEEALLLFLSKPEDEAFKTTQKHIINCKNCLPAFANSTAEKLSIKRVKDQFDFLSRSKWISDPLINRLVNAVLEEHFKKNIEGWNFENERKKFMSNADHYQKELKQIKIFFNSAKKGSDKAISDLLDILKDEDSNVAHTAAEALGELGNTSEEVISALINAMEEGSYDTRSSAAEALQKLGNSSERVISALNQALNDRNEEVRFSAAQALGTLKKS